MHGKTTIFRPRHLFLPRVQYITIIEKVRKVFNFIVEWFKRPLFLCLFVPLSREVPGVGRGVVGEKYKGWEEEGGKGKSARDGWGHSLHLIRMPFHRPEDAE